MAKITWSELSQRMFRTGVSHGVLYTGPGDAEESIAYSEGVPWNGLVSIESQPVGGEADPHYMDGVKYSNIALHEEFEGTLTAFYSPKRFDACDGSLELSSGFHARNQRREKFGLTYRTRIGNAAEGADYAYEIHFLYGLLASPAQEANNTINESQDLAPLSWGLTATPVRVPGGRPTSHLTARSYDLSSSQLSDLEDILYGTEEDSPYLPDPELILSIIN